MKDADRLRAIAANIRMFPGSALFLVAELERLAVSAEDRDIALDMQAEAYRAAASSLRVELIALRGEIDELRREKAAAQEKVEEVARAYRLDEEDFVRAAAALQEAKVAAMHEGKVLADISPVNRAAFQQAVQEAVW